MASAFSKLRQSSGAMSKLTDRIAKENKGGYDDARFWKLSCDKLNVGSATIRFLPASEGEEFPYVRIYEHGFQVGSRWYMHPCPTTINRDDCPVCVANNEAWNLGTDAGKKLARERKRNLSYIANIYVIKDPANPSNEGKVFLFKFGARIFQKIEGALKPQFDDILAINPFDLWEGANFKLKARELDGQRSYDLSAFDPKAPLYPDDDRMEAIWATQHPLLPFIGEDKFPSSAQLQSDFNKLYDIKAPVVGGQPQQQSEDVPEQFQRRSQPESQPAPSATPSAPLPWQQADTPQAAMERAHTAPTPQPAPQQAASGGVSLADKYRKMLGK